MNFSKAVKKAATFLSTCAITTCLAMSQASALLVGIAGTVNGSGMASMLNANGHTAVFFGTAAPNAAQLAGLDAMVLLRIDGNADIQNFVLGGGLLVTEWVASTWALNTANLLDATDSGGGNFGTTPVTFTAAGVAAGLSVGLSNPYSDGGQTEFFRSLTGIGAGVEILGTRPGDLPVIIGGASGLGSTLVIAYDWQDGSFGGIPNDPSEQLLLNTLNYAPDIGMPAPSMAAVVGLGLAGLGLVRRRRTA
jgi:hypothetical protein